MIAYSNRLFLLFGTPSGHFFVWAFVQSYLHFSVWDHCFCANNFRSKQLEKITLTAFDRPSCHLSKCSLTSCFGSVEFCPSCFEISRSGVRLQKSIRTDNRTSATLTDGRPTNVGHNVVGQIGQIGRTKRRTNRTDKPRKGCPSESKVKVQGFFH